MWAIQPMHDWLGTSSPGRRVLLLLMMDVYVRRTMGKTTAQNMTGTYVHNLSVKGVRVLQE